jgi:hypothetical protein
LLRHARERVLSSKSGFGSWEIVDYENGSTETFRKSGSKKWAVRYTEHHTRREGRYLQE